MNDASRARLELARGIAPAYAADPRVVAVVVGGSVAAGYADRWSDVELVVFWREAPTEEARNAPAAIAGAIDRRVFPDPSPVGALEEEFAVSGIKVDVAHLNVAAADRIVADVLERADPALVKQALVWVLRQGIALHGEPAIEGWRAAARVYPDALARAMVETHLAFGPHWWLEMLAERGDLLALYEVFCRVERLVLGVLLGLNRVFARADSFKWAHRIAGELAVAPDDLGDRLVRVFRAEPATGAREAARLIDDTVALVETHLPAIETARVRARLTAPRRLRDMPAPAGGATVSRAG